MVYRETFKPMNEQEITNIEIQFNVQLPTDYREYLKKLVEDLQNGVNQMVCMWKMRDIRCLLM